MISRLTLPEATSASLWVIASICQFRRNDVPGRSRPNAYSVKAVKSVARTDLRAICGVMLTGTLACFIWSFVVYVVVAQFRRGDLTILLGLVRLQPTFQKLLQDFGMVLTQGFV